MCESEHDHNVRAGSNIRVVSAMGSGDPVYYVWSIQHPKTP